MEIAKVSMGRGLVWIRNAISLVTERPAIWMGGTAVVFGLTFIFEFIPHIGWILNRTLQFVTVILALCYAEAQRHAVPFRLEEVMLRTRKRLFHLVIMMLLSSILFFICALPVMGALVAAGGMEFIMEQQRSLPDLSFTSTMVIAFGALISGFGSCLALAATSFTTPLILFQNHSVRQAVRLSFQAVQNNLGALLIYGLLMGILLLICVLPFGLGLIFGVPTAGVSFYLIYEELLGKPEPL
jgi:membrane-anchored glycerophosphoryl diester phosphodiesterase (GDPDase)